MDPFDILQKKDDKIDNTEYWNDVSGKVAVW
jgi:hypothetical protein